MNINIFLVSLGCDKNLVDSEVMLGMISHKGYHITQEEKEADIIIINSCCFIHDAKEESIETILEMAEYKKTGNCKGLIVTGCLSERYKDEILKEIPEVDGVLGTTNYDEIINTIEEILNSKKVISFKDIHYSPEYNGNRILNTTTAYSYLKISEGCNNNCTYCIIPSLRGRMRSRTIESLLEEATFLARSGKTELILVAQDSGKYGLDLYNERTLPKLLKALCEIEGIRWIRLLYCYPEDVTEELIETMATEEKIVNYIDIPIQHINNDILKKMARKSTKETVLKVIQALRKRMPDICIRSTFITGFPGETEEQFQELRGFLEEYRLDRVGVFTYSIEEGTKAATMENQIDENIKEARRDELMNILQQISLDKNSELVDAIYDVLIEGYIPDDGVYFGRTYRDAPNVDSLVFVKSDYNLILGQMVEVRITEVNEYDLIGVITDEFSE